MGLCKCPHRKVTNIFCYEHRVNVCEYCLVQNHPKCVVDTYRNWITDSVFSSKCGLCDQELASADTVRLLCFHIVHWDCLDAWARSLPDTTAPAGYSCPICNKMCLFPPMNQISPIADELRLKMGQVNWARAGLGLPLMDNESPSSITDGRFNSIPKAAATAIGHTAGMYQNSDVPDHSFEPSQKFNRSLELQSTPPPQYPPSNQQSYSNSVTNTTSANLGQNSHYATSNNQNQQNHYYSEPPAPTNAMYIPRKTMKSEFELETPLMIDEDDHKYRRRSPFESLSRWIKNSATVKSRRGRKRTAVYVILAIIVTFVVLMLMFGRSDSDDESGNFNPGANPNVMIGAGLGLAENHQADVGN